MTQTMGQAIKQARKMRGATQEALAAALGVTRAAITQWEKDLTHPTIPKLLKLGDFLKVDAGALVLGRVISDEVRHVSYSEQLPPAIKRVAEAARQEIGFEPTSDQALRWLAKKALMYDAIFGND